MKEKALGESEAIRILAQAKKEEAQQLTEFEIASKLELLRATGESGAKLFGDNSKTFVFGKNPGDVL